MAVGFIDNMVDLLNRHVNLMPGPVTVSPLVSQAFSIEPISHRSSKFMESMLETKKRLCRMVGTKNVQIMMGSGTLANDAIAAQLSLENSYGLMLSNGEFGERLIDQAYRAGLQFDVLKESWGNSINKSSIDTCLETKKYKWIWFVHCETSTGVLNDLDYLKDQCNRLSIKLVVDCISSIGTLDVDLTGVFLGSGVSGKGLASYPGLAFVLYNHDLKSSLGRIPSYMDLGLHSSKQGVPFTMSSNLLLALSAALYKFQTKEVFQETKKTSDWLAEQFQLLGFQIIGDPDSRSPAVITIELPRELNSVKMGNSLEKLGFYLSYNSEYLRNRNWIQVCLMGEFNRPDLDLLISEMVTLLSPVEV